MEKINKTFILKEKIFETQDVTTLKFKPLSGEIFSFIPGQFAVVYPENVGMGKSYTITSMLGEKTLNFTIKKIGNISGILFDSKIGDKFEIDGPRGHFYPNEDMNNIVFIAGGIGITPFYTIIKDLYKKAENNKKIVVFYSNKTKKDIIFFDELNKMAEDFKNLKIVYFLTRENVKDQYIDNFKRIDEKSLENYFKDSLNYYFICGSIGFVKDIRKIIKEGGVREENIVAESFY